jgi:hypothetical protein
MLARYWGQQGDFRSAFLRWAEELTDGYDRAHDAGTLPSQQPTLPTIDHDAIAAACALHATQKWTALGELLKPLHGNGVTLRMLTEHTGIGLRWVVGAVIGPQAVAKASAWDEMERTILREGPPSGGLNEIERRFGTHSRTARDLLLAHGIDARGEKNLGGIMVGKTPYSAAVRAAAERCLIDEGLSLRVTAEKLAELFPNDERLQRGIDHMLLSRWRKRARARIEEAA